MARLEGAYDQVNHRLGRIESEISELRASFEKRFADVDRKLSYQFFWLLGVILVSIIIPQVQHYAGR